MNDNRWWNRLDSARAGRTAYGILVAICVITVLAGLLVDLHGHYRWEEWFAFFGIYGFVGCFLLVVAARGLRKLVMRDEEYYDRNDE